jgi:organic radical activating enzyme
MSPARAKLPSLSAALAGVPAGVQPAGPWMGRRQLFVRFAGEAETATIYTADALRGELTRLTARSRYHSIAITGRDPLAESEFLAAAFRERAARPVMLDHDGQRPEALSELVDRLDLVQVTIDGGEADGALERVYDSIARAAGKQVAHALAIVPADTVSDARLLQVVEQVHAASAETAVVLHPSVESAAARDRRWIIWLERASAVHDDVRVLPVGRMAAG